jgi:hypothetical protein
MSNAFTNFLGSVASGIFDTSADVKTYQHADRLYVKDTYARAPKFGHLYYVVFGINQTILNGPLKKWAARGKNAVGFLVKKIDLPKFQITVEEINQYNRKTLIQKQIKYQPITIDFHDDNSNIITELWKNYYQYYFADSNYGNKNKEVVESFRDTKYKETNYTYGLANFQTVPFFDKIDIYVFHQQKYSQYTLLNPLISDMSHDSVEQDQSAKTLTNKMTVQYETVIYNIDPTNRITKSNPAGFNQYYDTSPSPLSIGGNGTNTLFGPGGVIAGADGLLGSVMNAKSPLDFLGAGIQAVQLGKNVKSLSKAGLKQEGYSIIGGILGNIQTTGNQPGGVTNSIRSSINNGNFGALSQVGVGLFKNATIDNTTTANLKKLAGGGG